MPASQVAGATKQRGNVVLQFIAGGRALAALTDALMREARLTAVRIRFLASDATIVFPLRVSIVCGTWPMALTRDL